MTHPDLSVGEYEKQAETTRRQLAADLQTFNDQLTPGHLLDEFIAYTKEGGGAFMRTVARSAQENPIPSLLVGTGCALFIAERMGFRGRHNGNRHPSAGIGARARTGADTVSATVANGADAASGAAATIGGHIAEGAESARDATANAVDFARDTVAAGAADAQRMASNAGAAAEHASEKARAGLADTAQRTKDATMSIAHHQPLLVAAIGLALGAALAAILPGTDAEDEAMGESSDRVKEGIKEAAREATDEVRTAMEHTVHAGGRAASDEGVGEAVRETAEKVARATEDTASAARRELHKAAESLAGD